MLQQINLYQEVLRKEKRALALLPLGLALLGVVLLLLAVALLLFGQNRSLRNRLSTLQGEQVALIARLAELPGQYPPREKSHLLEEEVARLVRAREARGPLAQVLERERQKSVREFSAVLESLARQNPPGVWLREVGIAGGGRRLFLAGSTREPQLAPRFLQQLAQESTLAGLEFEQMSMDRSQEDPGTLEFTLRTTMEGSK